MPRPTIALTFPRSAAPYTEAYREEVSDLAACAAAAVEAAGGTAVVLDSSAGGTPDADRFDGALILGGGDVDPARYGSPGHPSIGDTDPAADAFEAALIEDTLAAGRPVLGICRGMQLINVVRGGTLIEDLGPDSFHKDHTPEDLMVTHDAEVLPGTRLAEALGAGGIPVQSAHHQAVRDVGRGLRVAARAADGVIEAIESVAIESAAFDDGGTPDGDWVMAVQWHPEHRGTVPGQFAALLEPFISQAARIARDRADRADRAVPAEACVSA
ncbi:gamma-glutamyl-gamma-aminobutyrate hydrolase family protein [Arthrobacter ginkgonis]|uniref:Gamma-glutamyl-gamma-aminobutyrate hydrolase family protein n=1 Tax=Arthrobacter ginkgonis TaxID=1630594 RepID=A0ABP7CLJ0_9MICC